MLELLLFNEERNLAQKVTIEHLSDLSSLVEIYFGINTSNQIIRFGGTIIEVKNDINYYKLTDSDILIVDSIKTQSVDRLQETMEDMQTLSQVAYPMIHIKGQCNDMCFKIMVDSGAQVSIMTENMAKILKMDHLIDKEAKGKAIGVGETNILGCLYGAYLNISNLFIPINFHIVDNMLSPYLVLLGLDFLYNYKTVLDFNRRLAIIDNKEIKFLNEGESQELDIPYNIKKEEIKTYFYQITNGFKSDEKKNMIRLTSKIIDNILKNPSEEKFRVLNKNSSIIKNSISNNSLYWKFMNKIGFQEQELDKMKFDGDLQTLSYIQEIMCY